MLKKYITLFMEVVVGTCFYLKFNRYINLNIKYECMMVHLLCGKLFISLYMSKKVNSLCCIL